jgi:cytochrome P450
VARVLWLASTTAIEREITRSILEMVREDGLQTSLRNEPAKLKPFVEEIMRLYPPEHMVPRVTVVPVELGGTSIPAGQSVWLCTTAANRDPAKFERPSELMLERGPNSHVSFGAGPHVCSGAALTRRLIPAVLATLLSRTVWIEAAQPLEDVPYLRTVQTTSPMTLHVRAELALAG